MTYPEGLIKSTVHAAAIFIFPVRKIKFSSWEDILWHKKSLRLDAIGETVALPDRLLSSVSGGKDKENIWNCQIFLGKSFVFDGKRLIF